MRYLRWVLAIRKAFAQAVRSTLPTGIALLLLSGCTYPHLLNLPSDASGQTLNSPFAQQEPQLSGNYLVFVSDRNGSQDVYLYDLPHRRLVDLPGLNAIDMAAEHPSVSADGRFIVFAASRQGRQDIYLYDRQIQYRRNLTDGLNASVRNPSISADGRLIAYESNASGHWDIVLCDRAGKLLDVSSPELSTPEPGEKFLGEKSPDEKSLGETLTKTRPERRATPATPQPPDTQPPDPLTTSLPAADPALPNLPPSALEKRSPDEVVPSPAIAPPPTPSPPSPNDAAVTFPEAVELTGQQSDAAEEWDSEALRESASP
ncbi:TolB family protein [Thermoleptolyngbya sp.]